MAKLCTLAVRYPLFLANNVATSRERVTPLWTNETNDYGGLVVAFATLSPLTTVLRTADAKLDTYSLIYYRVLQVYKVT